MKWIALGACCALAGCEEAPSGHAASEVTIDDSTYVIGAAFNNITVFEDVKHNVVCYTRADRIFCLHHDF